MVRTAHRPAPKPIIPRTNNARVRRVVWLSLTKPTTIQHEQKAIQPRRNHPSEFISAPPRNSTPAKKPQNTKNNYHDSYGDDLFFAFNGRFAKLEKHRVIQRFFQPMLLRNLAKTSHIRRDFGLIKN